MSISHGFKQRKYLELLELLKSNFPVFVTRILSRPFCEAVKINNQQRQEYMLAQFADKHCRPQYLAGHACTDQILTSLVWQPVPVTSLPQV